MDIALTTPVAGGTRLAWRGNPLRLPPSNGRFAPCLPSSDASTSYGHGEISPWTPFQEPFMAGGPPGLVPGGRGAKGDILSKAE